MNKIKNTKDFIKEKNYVGFSIILSKSNLYNMKTIQNLIETFKLLFSRTKEGYNNRLCSLLKYQHNSILNEISTRKYLLKYCELDTYGMVKIIEKLKKSQ